MRWVRDVWFRLRSLLDRSTMDRELREEIDFHLEMETRKLEGRGMAPADARREARRHFGGVDRFTERTREAWGTRGLDDLSADVRFAIRQLGRRPAFAALAILTLALGAGGTASIFSVVRGLLLRPLPVEDADRLVVFWGPGNWRQSELALVDDLDLRALDGAAGYTLMGATYRDESASRPILTAAVSRRLFPVLGVTPALGRTFADQDVAPGAERVAVVSHGFWRQELGGDPKIVGRRITLDGAPATIVGVMPDGFFFPVPEARIWTPLVEDPADPAYGGRGWLTLVARVSPDATGEGIEGDLATITAALGDAFDYPEAWDMTRNASVRPLREHLLGDIRPALLLLLGAVGALLLVACANVASLLVARAQDRVSELAVRATLGAGRGRLTRQVVTEGLVLGVAGGVGGAALGATAFGQLVARLPLENGLTELVRLDWALLGAALILSIGAGVLVSLAPVRSVGRSAPGTFLSRERSRTGTRSSSGVQAALVTAQVALAVVLVSGAVVLARSVARLQAVDPGFDGDGMLAVDVFHEPGGARGEGFRFFSALAERAGSLPGVDAAGIVNRLPLRDEGWQGTVAIEDRPDLDERTEPNAYWRAITPGTFAALGQRLLQGRGITDADRSGTEAVVVISEAFARIGWPGGDPIGRRIRPRGFHDDWVTVIGVVEDVRLDGVQSPAPAIMYEPFAQRPYATAANTLILRSNRDPGALVSEMRQLVAELSPRAGIGPVLTGEQLVASAVAQPLRLRFFLSLFGGLALVLGMVGVYGVVAYAVSRRTREFGIRLAIGERPGALVRQVATQWTGIVGLGVLIGLVLVLPAAGALGRFVFGVQPTDPGSLAVAALSLLLAGATAAVIPALRAAGIDPVRALRAD
jgi:putative ABC transport system permease protein